MIVTAGNVQMAATRFQVRRRDAAAWAANSGTTNNPKPIDQLASKAVHIVTASRSGSPRRR